MRKLKEIVGDVVGVVCLFGMCYGLMVVGYGMGY